MKQKPRTREHIPHTSKPLLLWVFEYPRGSGNWYQGKHEPLITKELFDKVQEQMKRDHIVRQSKEFAFTKLMLCGLCGSGISADEKYKKLKNGKFNTHIYYGCTKAKDKSCKCGYINEVDLIKQLQELVDDIDVNESTVGKRVSAEVNRYKKFTQSLLDETSVISSKDIDSKDYVKFLLREGSMEEKREIMSCFKSKIILKSKKVNLEKS